MTAVLISGAAAFGLCLAATPLVRRLAFLVGATDVPDARRIHTRPTARGGGVGVFLAALIAATVFSPLAVSLPPGVLAGAAVLLIVGIIDDVASLRASTKLLAQIAAAALAVSSGIHFDLIDPRIDPALTAFWIVFVTNAFNLSDGLDGLAAGIGAISMLALCVTTLRGGDVSGAIPSAVLAGGLLGFLPYNFNPASIFLGDAGSLVIGYSLAVLPVVGVQHHALPPLAALLIAALPATDTALAIARRFLSRCLRHWGEGSFFLGLGDGLANTMRPDRRHVHHRLLDLGFSQRRAALLFYLAAGSTSALGYLVAHTRSWPIDLFALGLGGAAIALVQALGLDELQPARSGIALPVLRRLARRRWLLATLDCVIVALAHGGAIVLTGHPRFDDLTSLGSTFLVMAVAQVTTLGALGVYRTSWRSAGSADFGLLLKACVFGSAVGYACLRWANLPTGAGTMLVHFLLLLPGLGLMRFSYVLLSHAAQGTTAPERTLICGTSAEARHALARVRRRGPLHLKPIGFVEHRPRWQGRTLDRIPVLGTLDALDIIIKERAIQHLVIADPTLRGEALDWVRAVCRQLGVQVHRYIERLVRYEDGMLATTREPERSRPETAAAWDFEPQAADAPNR